MEIDFSMIEPTAQWLKLIAGGASETVTKEFFLAKVAPTAGCQSIVKHWARFRPDWDALAVHAFFMEALGKAPSSKPAREADGSLTDFGARQQLWQAAAKNPKRLRDDLERLAAIDLRAKAVQKARDHLPPEAKLEATFHVVVFGASNAFSVGKENGLDLLQLPRDHEGKLETDKIIDLFAHEMHHTGLFSLMEQVSPGEEGGKINLVSILVAEGSASYFIDQPFAHLARDKKSQQHLDRQAALDWEQHTARLPDLYEQAEQDIQAVLDGKLTPDDVFGRWIGSYAKGPAYVLGCDMLRLIDSRLGRKRAFAVLRDYRKLLQVYNEAARKTGNERAAARRFKAELVERVATYRGP